jgi:hypothetical protein
MIIDEIGIKQRLGSLEQSLQTAKNMQADENRKAFRRQEEFDKRLASLENWAALKTQADTSIKSPTLKSVGMTIGEALDALRSGKQVMRLQGIGGGSLTLKPGWIFKGDGLCHADIVADDWRIVE